LEAVAALFVAKPLNILAIAIAFLAGYAVPRFTALGVNRHPGPLFVASSAWGLYAAWEWLVQVKTPEADIRVDLVVIWPLLAVLSAWALFRLLRWQA
jgi:hypothetical protein